MISVITISVKQSLVSAGVTVHFLELVLRMGWPRWPSDGAARGNRQDVFTEQLFKVTSGTAARVATSRISGQIQYEMCGCTNVHMLESHSHLIHPGLFHFLRLSNCAERNMLIKCS